MIPFINKSMKPTTKNFLETLKILICIKKVSPSGLIRFLTNACVQSTCALVTALCCGRRLCVFARSPLRRLLLHSSSSIHARFCGAFPGSTSSQGSAPIAFQLFPYVTVCRDVTYVAARALCGNLRCCNQQRAAQ